MLTVLLRRSGSRASMPTIGFAQPTVFLSSFASGCICAACGPIRPGTRKTRLGTLWCEIQDHACPGWGRKSPINQGADIQLKKHDIFVVPPTKHQVGKRLFGGLSWLDHLIWQSKFFASEFAWMVYSSGSPRKTSILHCSQSKIALRVRNVSVSLIAAFDTEKSKDTNDDYYQQNLLSSV
jgi:hypothetical protein